MILAAASKAPAVYDVKLASWRTYDQLHQDAARLASLLQAPGKSLIFCFCRNDYGSLCGYLAGLLSGHVTALLDSSMSAVFRSALIERYRPDFILEPANPQFATASLGYCPLDSADPLVWRSTYPSETVIGGDAALLLSTSGSTGSPKLVRLSRANLVANARSISSALGIASADRAITSLPIHYSYGLSVINTHLFMGASLVLTDAAITSRAFWQTLKDLEVTSFAGVPYSYELLDRLGLPGEEFPSLSVMTQAGGKLQTQLISRFHQLMLRRHGKFFVMYGQTEATARIAILPPEYLPDKLGSVGRSIPGGKVLIDGDVSLCGSEHSGEIVYSGPNVMLGYAQARADLCAGDELLSTLRTGDLGHLDEDGFLFITGRLSRYAKLSGVRFNLDEVESLLRHYGPAAVVGTDRKLVVFCESQPESLAGYRAEFARQLSIHSSLLDFRRIPQLPLKANGKVDYPVLQELAKC